MLCTYIIVDGLVVEIVSVSIGSRHCMMGGHFMVSRNSVVNGDSMVNRS